MRWLISRLAAHSQLYLLFSQFCFINANKSSQPGIFVSAYNNRAATASFRKNKKLSLSLVVGREIIALINYTKKSHCG